MLIDAPMMGWKGGGAGAAVLLPDSFAAGDAPPLERPRMVSEAGAVPAPCREVKPLFEMKAQPSLDLRQSAYAHT